MVATSVVVASVMPAPARRTGASSIGASVVTPPACWRSTPHTSVTLLSAAHSGSARPTPAAEANGPATMRALGCQPRPRAERWRAEEPRIGAGLTFRHGDALVTRRAVATFLDARCYRATGNIWGTDSKLLHAIAFLSNDTPYSRVSTGDIWGTERNSLQGPTDMESPPPAKAADSSTC